MHIKTFIEENEQFDIKKYREPDKQTVYFICDEFGLILYVGKTAWLSGRLSEHFKKPKFAGKQAFFFSCSIDECADLEKKIIKEIKPEHNTQFARKVLCIKPKPVKKRKKRKRSKRRIVPKKYAKQGTSAIRELRKKQGMKTRGRIIAIMAQRNINPTDLANLLNVSRQRGHQIIAGDGWLIPTTVKKIARVLRVPYKQLI